MPILGLTDRAGLRPEYRELGRLRKGIKEMRLCKDGKMHEVMEDLDYFRFTSEDKAIEAHFRKVFGDQPRELWCYLPFATLEENFPTWNEEWVAGGMIHQCDGQTMHLWRMPNGQMSSERKPCPYATGEKQREPKARPPKPGCIQIGRLKVIIPELMDIPGAHNAVGYVTLATKSKNDCRNNSNILAQTEDDVFSTGGKLGLRGVKMKLWREFCNISTPSEQSPSGRARRDMSLVFVAPAANWVAVRYDMQRRMALDALEEDVEDDEDGAAPEAVRQFRNIIEVRSIPPEPPVEPPAGAPLTMQQALDRAEPPAPPVLPAYLNDADIIKAELVRLANQHDKAGKNGEPAPNKIGLMAAKMAEALGGGDAGAQKRHLVLKHVFGKVSSKELCEAEVLAMLETFVGQLDPATRTYPLKAGAKERLNTLATAALAAEGQKELL